MRLLVLIIVLALIVFLIWQAIQLVRHVIAKRKPWAVDHDTRSDGTRIVQLVKPGRRARVVKELPPSTDPLDLQSDLQSAISDAKLEAEVLNRP